MSSRGNFYDDLTKALRNCGWEIHRRNHGHDILKRGEQILTIPRKLDSVNLYKRLLKLATKGHHA